MPAQERFSGKKIEFVMLMFHLPGLQCMLEIKLGLLTRFRLQVIAYAKQQEDKVWKLTICLTEPITETQLILPMPITTGLLLQMTTMLLTMHIGELKLLTITTD